MADYLNNINKLYLFKFLKSLYFFSGVLIPFFTIWGGITFFQVMIIQSWFVFWVMALEIPTGAVADYFGRKTSIAIGAFINAAAVIVYTIMPNFYIFLLGEFLWALSAALVSGADQALLYDTLKEAKKEKDSKKIIGRYASFELFGIVVATPIGSFIAARYGLQYAVMAMSVPLFFAFLIALGVKEPPYRKQVTSENYFKVIKQGLSYFYSHKTLRILAFDSVSISVLSFFIIWLYQPMMQELGLPLAFFGVIHSLGAMLEIMILNNFSNFEKLLKSRKRYLFVSAIIVGIGYILLSISVNMIFSAILVIVMAGFGLTRNFAFINYMHKYIDSDKRATVLSSVTMLFSLGRGLLYPLVGLMVSYSLNLTLLALGILVLSASLMSKVEEKMLFD